MTRALQGRLRDGRVELTDAPHQSASGDVVVVFVDEMAEALPDAVREQVMKEMFDEMDLGFHMGGRPYAKREDLYDRLHRW